MVSYEDPACESIVSGAVCLATPFIIFGTDDILPFRIAVPVFSAGLAALVWFTFGTWRYGIAFFATELLCGLVFASLAGLGAEALVRSLKSHAASGLSSSAGCSMYHKFLIIHSLGDGVRGLLSTVSSLISSPSAVLRTRKSFLWLQAAHKRNVDALQHRSKLIFELVFALVLGFIICKADVVSRSIPEPIIFMSLLSYAAISGLLWVWILGAWCCAIGVLGAIVRAVAATIVFGPDLLLKALVMDIAVETTPQGGPWNVIQTDPFVQLDGEGFAQEFVPAHSVHAHPNVPSIILEWILSQV